MPSRIDTLQAPAGAQRGPLLVVLMVLLVVAVTIIVATTGFGWLVAMLVPVIAMSVYIVVNTIRVMVGKG